MSLIGEAVLRNLVRAQQDRGEARPQTHEDYHRWQFETSAALFAVYPEFDVRGKTILDIGCGIGGRTVWLASQGAARVAGMDINAEEIGVAREIQRRLYPQLEGVLSFHCSQETSSPDLGEFDYVLLVDTMEHVVSPPAVLRLAYQRTRLGGRCYFSTFGWYNHSASHTGLMPWVNVFFSDETIINYIRWRISQPDYRPSRFDSDPPIERWRGLYDLRDRPGEHLNKITLREIRKLIRYNIFGKGTLTLLPIRLRPRWFFRLLVRLPWLDELFHAYLVVRLDKTA